jgi:hypothetical protein
MLSRMSVHQGENAAIAIRPSACDRAAASVYDPDRLAPGILLEDITVEIADSACSAETAKADHAARADYQIGRALRAKGDANGARRQFELAVAEGYRVARIDLADLLVDPSSRKDDPGRAVDRRQLDLPVGRSN